MIYYLLADLTNIYDISQVALKQRIKIGSLMAEKLYHTANTFAYIVPESELYKLENLKRQEPVSLNERIDYYKYMRSERWQEIRRERLQLDGFKCQICGTGKNLEVHHVNYEHLGQPAEIDDLVTLCRECHMKVHENEHNTRRLSFFDE